VWPTPETVHIVCREQGTCFFARLLVWQSSLRSSRSGLNCARGTRRDNFAITRSWRSKWRGQIHTCCANSSTHPTCESKMTTRWSMALFAVC